MSVPTLLRELIVPGRASSSAAHPALRTVCGLALVLGLLYSNSASRAQEPQSDTLPLASAVSAPAWMDQAVVYEIFPRHFSPEGTLNAVTARLDTLHTLGVNVLWIMPVHPIGEKHRLGALGSPYAARDFYGIDPALGTKADFTHLVEAAHALGMRVILDIAADHTAWDSVMMAHPEFYTHDAAGHIVSPHGWSDVAGLNYDNPALREYMVQMFTYWLKTFNLDGFRCDAAGFVPTSFWEQLRPALQAVRPDVLLLAESSKPELMTKAFDLDYGWPLLATFNEVVERGKPATAIEATWNEQQGRFPRGTEHMLISDDHDEQRAMVRYGTGGALAVSALVFTLPGVPLLYNGMEVGDATPSGAPALFEKFHVYWGAGEQRPQFAAFYRAIIQLRASSTALRHGDLIWLHNSDEQHVISFIRRSREETDLVTVNLSNTPFRGSIEVTASGNQPWQEVSLTPPAGSRRHPASATVTASLLPALPALSLDAFQVRIFRLPAPTQP
jgi:cyclomaltodextrinase / maltogenic alpha-amylase / neopullulanase